MYESSWSALIQQNSIENKTKNDVITMIASSMYTVIVVVVLGWVVYIQFMFIIVTIYINVFNFSRWVGGRAGLCRYVENKKVLVYVHLLT